VPVRVEDVVSGCMVGWLDEMTIRVLPVHVTDGRGAVARVEIAGKRAGPPPLARPQ